MDDETRGGARAVVIGAGSGMGAAAAKGLHEQGYDLLLADVAPGQVNELAASLGAQAAQVDISQAQSVAALADLCRDGVDALVLTAGLSMSMASFERVMDVNLRGAARVLEQFRPVMRKGGAAVCLASIAGHLTTVEDDVKAILDAPLAPDFMERLKQALAPELQIPGMAYGLSKLGVLRLVKRTGVAWGASGVRICSISPGVIDTPMGALERKSNPDADGAIGLAPVPRLGRAEEVANVAVFLCSPQASYVTACDVLVDGGWVGAIETASEDSPFARALAGGRAKS